MSALLDLSPRELVLAVMLLVCDAFGLVVGARLLSLRSAPRPRVLRDAVVWLAFGAAWSIVWSAATLVVLQNKFAVLRMITHVLLFVMAPLALARGIAWIRAGRRSAGLLPVAVGLGMVALYAWAYFVEPRRIEFSEHRISTPRTATLGAPVRVAVLADVQTDSVGPYEADVFRRTAAALPDLVLLPGDFVQADPDGDFAEQARRFRQLFELLEPWPPLGVHAVFGDIDPDPTLFEGTRVQVIDGETVMPDPAVPLQLIGLSLAQSRRPLTRSTVEAIDRFAGYTIVMGHAPDYAMPVIEGALRPDALLLAGHTHGGQVVVPGFGPPITLTSVPRRFAAGGLFDLGATRLCVSRGVGLERGFAPRVRFWCRPQVVLIDLVPAP